MEQVSPAIALIPAELREEYLREYQAMSDEIASVEGVSTMLKILLDRYVFVHIALRHMETSFLTVDMQRYNQLSQIFVRMGRELLLEYQELYKNGAANDLLASKIISIVAEVVDDKDQLKLIRERIKQTKSTVPTGP